jgi:hypothetical protein
VHTRRLLVPVHPGSLGPEEELTLIVDLDRFWTHVERRGASDCWPWTASRDKQGYGNFKANGRMHRANRWILAVVLGRDLEPTEVARHSCDNPPCCNPAHLTPGSPRDNSHDARDRGRLSRGDRHWTRVSPERLHGSNNPASRLTAEQITGIRDLYRAGARQVDLAADFDVTQAYISQIVRRKAWAHVA